MAQSLPKSGDELFIVDNSDAGWKMRDYLREWTELARAMDIATGYFEVGALLALEGQWQKLDKIRILMGDEVTARTRKALMESVLTRGFYTRRFAVKRKGAKRFFEWRASHCRSDHKRKSNAGCMVKRDSSYRAFPIHGQPPTRPPTTILTLVDWK